MIQTDIAGNSSDGSDLDRGICSAEHDRKCVIHAGICIDQDLTGRMGAGVGFFMLMNCVHIFKHL